MTLFKNFFLALIVTISLFNFSLLHSDERVEALIDQIQIISQDLKTLEKAFYKNSDIVEKNKSTNNNNLTEDVLTKHLLRLNEIEEQDSVYLSKILLAAKEIARQVGIERTGYRLITNCGFDGGQEINYLHFHLVGGLKLGKMISLSKDSKKIFRSLKSEKIGD